MQNTAIRRWLIYWMYGTALMHLVAGMLLPWLSDAAIFDAYHHAIESAFWGEAASPAARAQQLWWIALFGPTVQGLSIWMMALIRIGDRYRSRFAWGALIGGIAIWAPQDMLISLRIDCWVHVWLDSFALITMLPPLIWLWFGDKHSEWDRLGLQSMTRQEVAR